MDGYEQNTSYICLPVLYYADVTIEAQSAAQGRFVFGAIVHAPPELLIAAFRLIDFPCANETHYQLINMNPECHCDI